MGETRMPVGWRIRFWLCVRLGLHFMSWSYACDGYKCACNNQHLWAEEIRDGV